MLAQNFKSAADLAITEPQLSALIKTLALDAVGASRLRRIRSPHRDKPLVSLSSDERKSPSGHPRARRLDQRVISRGL
jgi:hypothetical protein